MTTVISVENLSKYYRLGTIGTGTLSHDLNRWWARLRGKPDPLLKIGQELPVVSQQSTVNSVQSLQAKRKGLSSFIFHAKHSSFDSHPSDAIWALRDVSFEVKQGEVLGIIGRNGAGKSTLLKILSRVTAPTSGEVKVKGRIASLLEVGTGFHPELTGRENIYLNGAILGMSKREITRKFDEIVAFAEVEKFIDTPVKRYSSGMYVRLAFAVAAHLEPEILLVDEVLAVGDAAFQKKCLGKMGDVAREGRTVLFVSHNMAAIVALCQRTILVQQGNLVKDGMTQKVVEVYLNRSGQLSKDGVVEIGDFVERSGTGEGRIEKIEFESLSGLHTTTFGIGEPFLLKIYLNLERVSSSIVAGIEIKSMEGIPLLNLRSDSQGFSFGPYAIGEQVVLQVRVPGLPLYPGSYHVEPWFADKRGKRIDHIHGRLAIVLESKGYYQSEMMIQRGRGLVLMDCLWDS